MNFGRYRVERKLGEDPLGELYLVSTGAKQDGPERAVLRLLRAALCRDPALEKRCLDLVHAIRLLALPELVRLLSVGRLSDGRIYLTMEHVEEPTLRKRLREGPLPPQLAIHLAQSLATVLAAAHKKGLVHLALRPEVVYLGADGHGSQRVRLAGLGLARLVKVRPEASAAPYLAPELTEGGPGQAGAPADVYALGAMLYEMLTGRNRLQAEGSRGAPPVPVDQLVPALGKGMSVLLQAMQARDLAQRPLMADVADRLAQVEEGLLIGQTIGSYKILGRIAQGGMGTVFRAVNEQIGRPAAIKVLRAPFAQAPEVVKRFLNEARATNLIRHPNLVEVYEFGQLVSGQPYLVMELLQGESLETRRQRRGGTLPETEALAVGRQVALAVAAAHEKGIIHRDLKPDNIMLVPDPVAPGGERVKLLDFGIAKVMAPPGGEGGGDATLVNTFAGALMGTPGYMAPEQLSGAGSVTERTDVYALGAILYELLTGRRPQDALRKDDRASGLPLGEPPPPLRQLQPQISADSEALILRMLSFLPGERPTMAEVARALGPAERAPEPLEERPLGSGRRLWILLGAGGLMALSTAVALWSGQRPTVERPGKRAATRVERTAGAVRAAAGPAPEAEPAAGPAPLGPAQRAALRAQAVVTLREALSGDEGARAAAAAALGAAGDATLRVALEPLLADQSPRVQGQAALALAQLLDQDREAAAELVPRLVRLVESTTDGATFVDAAAALDRLGDARGRKRLHEALLSREPSVRRRAAQMLTERGDRDGLRVLRKAVAEPQVPPAERVAALGVLAERGDDAARGQLGALLTTGEGELRLRAAAELARYGDDTGRAALEQALKRGGAQEAQAARGLATLRDERSCAVLGRILVDGKRPLPERVLAAEGLGHCGSERDVAPLGQALQGEASLRQAAAAALLRILRP